MELDSTAPDDDVVLLTRQWRGREEPIQHLCALLSPTHANPSTIVVYGPKATGKTVVLESILRSMDVPSATIESKECVTGRHLLECTLAAVREALPEKDRFDSSTLFNGRCENISSLSVHLQRLLEGRKRFFLVFDGVDRQREAPPTLLPALARLGESIPPLVVVLIVRHPPSRFLRRTGVPHVSFPPYSRDQSIEIVAQEPPLIFTEPIPAELDYDEESHAEDRSWLWERFCAAVWDSVGQNSARNLTAFREVCAKLWRPFVEPVVRGEFGTRQFSRLLVAQRRLFQDESFLLTSMVSGGSSIAPMLRNNGQDMPYYAKWTIASAYLASYNPIKSDALYFMKSSERRKGRKKGGGAKAHAVRQSQKRKIPRHLLGPSPFTLDRLLSILHAILPHSLRSTYDIYAQVSTLTNLRLLVRTAGLGSSDPLEPGAKWKVGASITWEYVQALSRTLDFAIIDFLAE